MQPLFLNHEGCDTAFQKIIPAQFVLELGNESKIRRESEAVCHRHLSPSEEVFFDDED